jgi:hypothetical protein
MATPNLNTKPGTRIRDYIDANETGTFLGWDEEGDALIQWDGYEAGDSDSVNAGYVRIITEAASTAPAGSPESDSSYGPLS